jgi:hypothetical protein
MEILGSSVVLFDKRIPAGDVASVYNYGLIDRLQFAAIRSLPLIAYRGSAWTYVELLRRQMSGMGMPPIKEDFAELETENLAEFDHQAEAFTASPGHLNNPMERILKDSKARGYNVILVLMPVSPSHVSKYYNRPSWMSYVGTLKTFSRERGLTFVDGTGWFHDPEDFKDKVHLRVEPNPHLTECLAKVIAEADHQRGIEVQAK